MTADNHHWTVRNLYLYLICGITLLLAIFAVVEIVKSVTELVYPEPLQPYMLQSYKDPENEAEAIDAELEARQQDLQHQWSVRESLISLVRSVAMLFVAGPLYLYHWRKIERMSTMAQPIE